MKGLWNLLVVSILFIGLCSIPAGATPANEIQIEYNVSQSASNSDVITISLTTAIPDKVTELTLKDGPGQFEVISSNGYRKNSDGTVTWTKSTQTPTMVYEVPVQQQGLNGWGLGSANIGGRAFVNLNLIDFRFSYRYYPPNPSWSQSLSHSGDGINSASLAYLGPYEKHDSSNGKISLIVPSEVSPKNPPPKILKSLELADSALNIGPAPRRVDVFVVKDPMRMGGLAPHLEDNGVRSVWVHESVSLNTVHNVWVHEYIHTRQSYTVDEELDWFTEGSADYYAGLLTLNQGNAEYSSFYRLSNTTGFEESVQLSKKETWGNQGNYQKGRRVLAALDAQIVQQTNHTHSLDNVFRMLNEDTKKTTVDDVADYAVQLTGNESMRHWVYTYFRTTRIPSVPNDPSVYARGSWGGDSDSDGLSNEKETRHDTHPFSPDTDSDLIFDGDEISQGTSPHDWDTDFDGISDIDERNAGTNPVTKTSLYEYGEKVLLGVF